LRKDNGTMGLRRKMILGIFILSFLNPSQSQSRAESVSQTSRFDPPRSPLGEAEGLPSPSTIGGQARYEIEAVVDTVLKKITASQKIRFVNPTANPIGEVYFHIYPQRLYTAEEKSFMQRYASYFKVDPFPEGFPSGRVEIHSITQNGESLKFEMGGEDRTLLKVFLPEALAEGAALELRIEFSVDVPHAYGRFGWHEDIWALSRWYPILSILNDDGWHNHPFYPFHRPFFSEAAYYSVKLTVPADEVVVHSGQLKGEESRDNATKTLTIETAFPIREFTLAMSPRYKVIEENFNGVKIKSFYLEGDAARGRQALGHARDLMKFYFERFGPYPYEEFSIAPVHLGYGGEQMSNMIFLDTRVYRLPGFLNRYFDFLVAHETGHQWFYNLIGVDEFNQMWLEEGVNSYFLLEHLEDKYGKSASVIEWPPWLKWLLPNFSFRHASDTRYKMIARTDLDRPVVGELSSFREPSSIFSLTYGKGLRIVAMLKTQIGEDAFRRVFARIFKEYRFKNLSQNDFIRICEEESGQDLQWFFSQWLQTTKVCDYAVDRHAVFNRGTAVMPVKIKIIRRDGTKEIVTWDGRGRKNIEDDATLADPANPIQEIVVDPQEELLDIDRTDNVWPRRIKTRFVPLHLGLYDLAVFLPDDSYNLVVGPELANSGVGVKASLLKPYDWNFYAATDYELGENLQHSRLGFQRHYLFHSQTIAGFELFNTNDTDGDEEDLAGGKVYIRRELWPAAYSLTEVNDHVTLYLLRDRSLKGDLTLSGLEDSRNVSYLKKDEAIVGTSFHLGRSGPLPDPRDGYKVDAIIENSGHFLGATQYFTRSALDMSFYQPVTAQSKAAFRLKAGWGTPDDKSLFELGGINGLRGFERKTARGAKALLGSIEYRFPLVKRLDWSMADHWIGLESIGGVVFFDLGQAWFEDFEESTLKKDAGVGLRFTVNLGSFLEKVVVRLDASQAIHDPREDDPHFWLGLNHAF